MSNNGKKTYNYSRANNNSKSQPPRPKKITCEFPLVLPFGNTDRNGVFHEADHNIVLANLEEINNSNLLNILTTNVSIARSLISGDESKKGNAICGFLNGFDLDKMTASVTVYPTNSEAMTTLMGNTMLGLDIRINAYNGEFHNFNGFFLIPIEVDDSEGAADTAE